MPLKGYDSICEKNARIVISKDYGGQQTHIAHNESLSKVFHYKVDGVILQTGNKCDFLLLRDGRDSKTAYFIELKGSDLCWAAKQLEQTADRLSAQLSGYDFQYRIVANRCKTQEIENTSFKKYRIRWGKRLIYKTGSLTEKI